MSDDAPELAEVPAPELETTAAPEPVETATPEEQAAEQEASKTFTQEELDAIVGKRLAREQRKWEREQQQRLAEKEVKRTPPADIHPQDFASYDDYAEVLRHIDRRVRELFRGIPYQEAQFQYFLEPAP